MLLGWIRLESSELPDDIYYRLKRLTTSCCVFIPKLLDIKIQVHYEQKYLLTWARTNAENQLMTFSIRLKQNLHTAFHRPYSRVTTFYRFQKKCQTKIKVSISRRCTWCLLSKFYICVSLFFCFLHRAMLNLFSRRHTLSFVKFFQSTPVFRNVNPSALLRSPWQSMRVIFQLCCHPAAFPRHKKFSHLALGLWPMYPDPLKSSQGRFRISAGPSIMTGSSNAWYIHLRRCFKI